MRIFLLIFLLRLLFLYLVVCVCVCVAVRFYCHTKDRKLTILGHTEITTRIEFCLLYTSDAADE